jgi:hypothetical protein
MAKGLTDATTASALMLIRHRREAIAGVTVKPGCDFIGTDACQFPWPNDYFTKRDSAPTPVAFRARQSRPPAAAILTRI